MRYKKKYITIALLIAAVFCAFALLRVNSLYISTAGIAREQKDARYCKSLSDPEKAGVEYVCFYSDSDPTEAAVVKTDNRISVFVSEKETDTDPILKSVCFFSFAVPQKAAYRYWVLLPSPPGMQPLEIFWDGETNQVSIEAKEVI